MSITVTEHGLVTLFTFDRPDKGNALTKDMVLDLQARFDAFEASDQRVAVIAGSGDKFFTAGADVYDPPELWRAIPTVGIQTNKPVIAATAGWVVGGGIIIAIMADLCVAAKNSQFSYPEARLGFTGGMVAGLAARIPHKIAMEVMLLAEPMSAARAYEAGLVNRVVPTGTQVEVALEMATKLATFEPKILSTIKRFVVEDVLPSSPAEQMWRTRKFLNSVNNSADPWANARGLRDRDEKAS